MNKDPIDVATVMASGDWSSDRCDVLSILWAVTKGCNYDCSYCPYSRDVPLGNFSSRDEILRAARLLLRLGRPGYQITLYGGEPTYHPHLLDLAEFLSAASAPVILRMYTNGSRPPSYFHHVCRRTRVNQLGIIFSLHPEFVKFKNFLACVEETAQSGMAPAVSIMFSARHRDAIKSYVDQFFALRMSVPFFFEVNLPYTTGGIMGSECTEDDFAWIKSVRDLFAGLPQPTYRMVPAFTRIVCDVVVKLEDNDIMLSPEDSLRFLNQTATPSYKGFYCCSGTNVLFLEEDGRARGGVCSA